MYYMETVLMELNSWSSLRERVQESDAWVQILFLPLKRGPLHNACATVNAQYDNNSNHSTALEYLQAFIP